MIKHKQYDSRNMVDINNSILGPLMVAPGGVVSNPDPIKPSMGGEEMGSQQDHNMSGEVQV